MTIGTNTPEIRSASRWTCALPGLGILDQFGHLSQLSVGADPGGTHDQPPAGVDRGPDDGVSRPHLDRHGLAGEHARVDRRRAVLDHAVGGDLFAGPNDEDVAHDELVGGDPGFRPVSQDGDVLGAELQQGAQCGAGEALGAGLASQWRS